jgi:hypothetical protein
MWQKITDNLEKKGLVQTRTFGKNGFIEVLESGKDVIRYIGLKPKEAKGGGFDHTVGVELVEDNQKKLGNSTKLEVDILSNRIDLESSNSISGQKVFFNIGVSDPIREATNIISILKVPVVQNNRFVFVARDARFAGEVKKALKQKDPTGEIINQIEIKTISDYVEI